MTGVNRLDRAKQLYDLATFGGDREALPLADRELDGIEADLSLARGRIVHARFLAERFGNTETEDTDAGDTAAGDPKAGDPEETASTGLAERERELFARAAELHHRVGDTRGEAESLFWLGTFHQVVNGDSGTALPYFERSYELASTVGDKLTLSYAARHLGFAHAEAGERGAARIRFEESIRLRREIGFMPGVAAGILALAEFLEQTGDPEAALALMSEAEQVARDCGAAGVLRWIEAARAEL